MRIPRYEPLGLVLTPPDDNALGREPTRLPLTPTAAHLGRGQFS